MSLDHQQVWGNCLKMIKDVVGDQAFNTWFDPIIPLKLEDDILTIQVPSQFFYEWLEEHYVHILRDVIYQELGNDGKLEYSIVIDRGNSEFKPYTINIPTSKRRDFKSKQDEQNGNSNDIRDIFKYDFQLNRNYTFETFIEGDCNRLARSAGYAVAQRPGITSFNPLMVYGGVGLGKTHLAQAIGNDIIQNIPGKSVIYVPAEKFTQQFIESVKINKIQEFQNFYNKIDILILDDVQFLSGREKTQEIFFHIFNHLHQLGKQIIMTSDCPPKDLKGLEERLLSRFKWGLTADLQQPDFETRIAIIQKKMQADGINIPENVLEYLAYSVDTNIRELEGVLISLIAHGSLMKRDIDLELAKQTLKTIIHDIDTEVSIDYIQKTIAEYFHLKIEDLKDKTRKKEVVIARQLAMYFSKEYTNHSLKSIGYHFGGRDHSTVIHAVQTVNDMYDVDNRFRSSVDELKKKLKMKSV
ncbi:MAG: chromosomal replication initiator protein DnaA [Cyclobacteriaceae bacterium]|nr:chromosomal replication initiator protein DnaA [Cyclobacteriaceae bacterium]